MNFKTEKSHGTPSLTTVMPLLSTEEKIADLELKIAQLSKICNELNPYQEISEVDKNQLKLLGILDFSNPFHLTNSLIVLLEDSIEELHQLRPIESNENNETF